MKKLKFYVPVLAIACAGIVFSTTSCVEDTESQSVTELRGARAEQMKAEAALATAQAEAAKIVATAEAALLNAQAEAEKAQAKLTEAEAAHQAAQTEADKAKWAAEIEVAKEAARQAKAVADIAVKDAEYKLEQMKLQAEIDLLNLQNQLEIAKNDDPVLVDAIGKYSTFIAQVNGKKMQIATKNLELTKLKALLADKTASREEMAATQIKYKNEQIASITEAIEANKIEIANWNVLLAKGGADIEAEVAELKKQRDDLIYNKSADLAKVRDEKNTAKDAARQAVVDFRNLSTINPAGGYIWNYLYELSGVTYYTVGELNIQITNYKGWLADQQKSLEALEEDYNKAESELEPLFTAWKTAEKAIADAWTAYTEADENYNEVVADAASTPAQIQAALDARNAAYTAYTDAISAESTASTKYDAANSIVDSYPAQIQNQKNNIESYNTSIASLTKAVEAYGSDSDAPRKLEAAYAVAYEAYQTAQDEFYDVQNEINALQSEMDKLNNIYYSEGYATSVTPDYIKGQIKMLEDMNIAYTNDIAQVNRDINEITADKTYAIETLKLDITGLEAEIAQLTVELGVAQKQADAAKAIVDARTK